jgi:hypothetical protein
VVIKVPIDKSRKERKYGEITSYKSREIRVVKIKQKSLNRGR